MIQEQKQLSFIDLISERHVKLRQLCNEMWNNNHDLYISNSEWQIIAIAYQNRPTISHVTKKMGISRQATHKLIKNMEINGLVEPRKVEDNNKDKCLQLTPFGETCYEENERIKATIEKQILTRIGADNAAQLKALLQLDWGL